MSVQLTKRQQDVLQLVKMGASNKQIAQRLNLSESTIKLHMTSLLKKFAVQNRSQLAIFSTPGYKPSMPVPPSLEAKPVGWIKRTKNEVRGVVFTAKPPDETWEAIYTKRD
jgi:DNA-binding CsgD family transcriptional regulator